MSKQIEEKNKRIRIASYMVLAFSICLIGFLAYYGTSKYFENQELRTTMEEIIESNEEDSIVSQDYTYNDYFSQDTTIDTIDGGKVLVEFPNA